VFSFVFLFFLCPLINLVFPVGVGTPPQAWTGKPPFPTPWTCRTTRPMKFLLRIAA
jgi:hypothetical protein